MQPSYKISNLLPATESILMEDVYLVLFYAKRVPPHLLISVNGRLTLPPLFTFEQLTNEIRNCTLAYPRVDIGIATCLSPIKDFCHSVYETESKNVNLIFDLLPKLQERNALKDCYQMNLGPSANYFELKPYQVYDVHEAIRKSSLVMA